MVFVHILNPYGMAWLRRTNENSVDLNRNFLLKGAYAGAPEGLAPLDPFLNPQSPPGPELLFNLKFLWLITRYGMASLKQSVAGGQYKYPKGLFYGGKKLEEGPVKYQAWLKRRLKGVKRLVFIDVHSGLGPWGEDSLLVEPEFYGLEQKAFGNRVYANKPQQGPSYKTRGGILAMTRHVASRAESHIVCQEFGTFNIIRVLRALRQENRWHHWGGGSLSHRSKAELKEAFCPDSLAWRNAIMDRGKSLIEQSLGLL